MEGLEERKRGRWLDGGEKEEHVYFPKECPGGHKEEVQR